MLLLSLFCMSFLQFSDVNKRSPLHQRWNVALI